MKSTTATLRRLWLATICAVAATAIGWLIGGAASPFRQYFLWHVSLPNLWATLNLPAVLVGVQVSGNVHQPNEIAFWASSFAQWFLIGYLVSLLFFRRSSAQNRPHEEAVRA